MKKIIFTICCTVFFAFSMSAQVTLTDTNMNLTNVAGVSTLAPVVIDASALSVPFAPHLNGTWDLTNLYYGPTFTSTRLSGPAPFSYSDTVFEANFGVRFRYLRLCNTYLQGFIQTGIQVDTQFYHANDDTAQPYISFPNILLNPLPTAYAIMPLPLTYPNTWSANNFYTMNFYVFDTGWGLTINHAEIGYVVETVAEKDSVVGYGKMRVNRTDTVNGALTKSGEMNVLQVNRMFIQTDSTYLTHSGGVYDRILDSLHFPKYYTYTTNDTGAVIDSTLHFRHSTFDTVYQQLFYRRGTLTPLVTATFADAGHSTLSSISVNTDNLSIYPEAIANVSNSDNINIYPNPVANNVLFIDITNAKESSWSYELINTAGQVMSSNTIASGSSNIHSQVTFPTQMAAGVYYLRIKKDGLQYSVKALDIVK